MEFEGALSQDRKCYFRFGTFNLRSMLHTWDPFAVKITSTFGIRWYGLSYLAGFIAGYYLILGLAKRHLSTIPSAKVGDFIFSVALGTVIGGRLGYCIFYSPDLFTRVNSHFPFWGVLAVNEGGMASHGGIAGIIIAATLFARRNGFSPLHAIDLCALSGPIGVFFGRLANFINGELVGRSCQEAWSWCVKFPQDILAWPQHEPERLASLYDTVALIGVQRDVWSGWISRMNYDRSAWNGVEQTLSAIIEKVQSGNPQIINAIGSVLTLRHPSQLYEAALEGLFLFCALFLLWARPQKPGVIMGAFLTLYSVVRIVGEQFRMPDAHLGFQALGLTRGQWLSVAMLIVGLTVLVSVLLRKVDKIGGWYHYRKRRES